MSNTKYIVCLANSRKLGGYCFAGKEVIGEEFGGWVRPVSARDYEEISAEEQTLADGGHPKLLDIVKVPLLEPQPTHHQQENHLIHTGDDVPPWEKAGGVGRHLLPQLVDNVSGALWVNGNSSSNGTNDQIPVADARNLRNSLLLIQPTSLTIIVQYERYRGRNPPDVRADFNYNGCNYSLKVTDPVAEGKYQRKGLIDRNAGKELPYHYSVAVDGVYLCVSLGEEFHNYYYKLVAAIIGDED